MPRRDQWSLAGAATGLVAASLALPPTTEAYQLTRHAPVVVQDSREPSPLTSIEARDGRPRPAVYGRRVGPWLQYWMLFAPQRASAGTRSGDWALVQYRLRGGHIVRAVAMQRAAAESCGAQGFRRSRGRPVIFVARRSHAVYFQPGVRDRAWPSPNDESDGRGTRLRPRLVRVTATSPARLRDRDSLAAITQAPAWLRPGVWAAQAAACTRHDCDRRGECDGRETAMAAGLAGLGVLWALWIGWRRVRRAEATS